MQQMKRVKQQNRIYFVMGVSGVGKSTVGKLLATSLGVPFFDGDDYHPRTNVKKMKNGEPLNDEDRKGWLEVLHQLAVTQLHEKGAVIACSALKCSYRSLLRAGIDPFVKWIHITGSFDLIESRMKQRSDHFMPDSLLRSQFETLEKPVDALVLFCEESPEKLVSEIISYYNEHAEFGLYGLGVMGKSLSRNMALNGVKMSLYNRHLDGQEENVATEHKNAFSELSESLTFDNTASFVASLEKPRKIFFMVNAGRLIDTIISELLPFLEEGDILMDGGNSHYNDTKRRAVYLNEGGIKYLGVGISGGEEGALMGPSIMPGGNKKAYALVREHLELIAAKDADQKPCCAYIGKDGAGHFVKMVHNGIEYAEMQLIAEVYDLLRATGMKGDEIAAIFDSWNSKSSSFLLEATIRILRKKENGSYLLDHILDTAGNKGTGNWATVAAAELGYPATLIASALFARYMSSEKDQRIALEKVYGRRKRIEIKPDMDKLYDAFSFARIINHHQGFQLLVRAKKEYNWNLCLPEIARIWTSGCIIKSTLMQELILALKNSESILQDSNFARRIKEDKNSLQHLVSWSVKNEIAIPCLSASLQYYYYSVASESSANLIQAQRDFFGAHTYQRKDDPKGIYYHTDWKR